MKACIITSKGLETYSEKEIKSFLKTKTEIKEQVVFFAAQKKEELVNLAYYGRTFEKVLLVINEQEFDKSPTDKFVFNYSEIKETFTVDGERYGEHPFNSLDIKQELGKLIEKQTNKKFDIKSGLSKFYFFVRKNYFVFGLDISGFDLSKRDYRIFLSPEAVKPTIAASMLIEGDYTNKKKLLDPYSKSGIICIEAAMMAVNQSPQHYSKNKFSEKEVLKDEIKDVKTQIYCYDQDFKHVNAAKKNAKIAGVNKYLDFSRQTVDDLDLKFDDDSIDLIITQPPKFSKRKDPQQIERAYKSFFRITKQIIKKEGKVVLLLNDLKAKEYTDLKIIKEQEVLLGEQKLWIVTLEK
ncbi:methyltransferase [Candidatus Woesearchaeota archaeon]|nr:methyltransferase [Candidatus Woesearchaeota archaeon]